MNQDHTPLFDAIMGYVNGNPAYFRIPGHRGENGVNRKWVEYAGPGIFRMDLTETPLLDDLHNPEGAIREAQELAADLFGADHSWFLVNGTTCGNEAMVIAAAGEGERIIVPRNAHKSVLMGLIISGASPEYLMPETDPEWGVLGGITPAAVEKALSRNLAGGRATGTAPGAPRAAFIVSPTYYGLCSDTAGIAGVCHAHGIPLLVDEAHGAHFYASPRLPAGALAAGADACAQSIHKVTGSLTQSSMLHLKSRMIDRSRIESALHILQSTSPSYLLMVSLDLAREELALRGGAAAARALGFAETARERINGIPGFGCLGREIVGRAGIADIDPTRLVISGARIGIDGFTLKKILFDKYRVDVELADWRNIVAIVTGGNGEEDMDRLVSGLRHIGEQMEESGGRRGSGRPLGHPLPFPPLPPRVLTPRRAFFAPKRQVPWTEAADKVAGEMIAPYPPGIPVIYPGEILTRETWEYLEQYRRDGRHIQGPADRELRTFMAISET